MTYTGPFPFDNTGTIDGILVSSSFTGNVMNDGTITTSGIDIVGGSITGAVQSTGNLAGGINVDRRGVVTANSADAIVAVGNFTGGIHNGGSLTGTRVVLANANVSGIVSNTGAISGAFGIVANFADASVFDSGVITASIAVFFSGGHNTLTLAAGYSINGVVEGAGSDTLQLGGSGSATFDPSKIGASAQYRGFTTFNVIGGTWTLTAAATESWTIKAGTLELGTGASIANQTITFAGSGAALQIDTALSQISGTTIASAMIGDTIDLRFQAYAAGMHAVWTHQNDMVGSLALLAGNGTTLATFSLTGVYDAAQFQAMSDNNGGTLIQVTAPLLPTPSANSSPPTPTINQSIPLSSLMTVNDPDGVGFRQLQLWDSVGGAGGRFFVGSTQQSAGTEIDVTPTQVNNNSVTFKAASVGGTDKLWARLLENDGSLTQWVPFPVTMEANLAVSNYSGITPGVSASVSSLVPINDPSGVGYAQLKIVETSSTGDGRILINNLPQNIGQEVDLTPTQANAATIAVSSFAGGGGTDTYSVQLLETDGTLTPWQSFTIDVPPPLAMNSIAAATPGASINITGHLVGNVNPGLVAPAQMQVWDSLGGPGGQFVVDGAPQTSGHEIDLDFSDPGFTNDTFKAAAVPGTDRLSARLKLRDGTLSPWVPFTVTVAEPSITINNTAVTVGKTSSVNVLGGLLAINDPSAVNYTTLELWDSLGGAAGGRFFNGSSQLAIGSEIDLTPSQAAAVTFKAAPGVGTDRLSARLLEKDGTLTPWQTFTVTVPQPSLALHAVVAGKNFDTGTSLVTINDPGNVGYQKLELWDSVGGEGGHFYFFGSATPEPEGQEIDVPIGVRWSFKTGTTGGTDRLWARLQLNDGSVTDYQPMSAIVLQPTVSAAHGTTVTATEGRSINLSDLFSINDATSVGYQTVELWESLGGAGGQLAVSGMMQTAGHEIDVSPADFADTVFNATNLAGGTDKLSMRLLQNDGTLTDWTTIAVTTAPAPTLNVNNFSGADPGQFIPLSSMMTVLDPGHENYQMLELWDSAGTVGGGVFVVNNVGQTAGHEIDVSLTDAAITGFFAGSAGVTDRLWARLQQNDGTTGDYQLFTVSTHT